MDLSVTRTKKPLPPTRRRSPSALLVGLALCSTAISGCKTASMTAIDSPFAPNQQVETYCATYRPNMEQATKHLEQLKRDGWRPVAAFEEKSIYMSLIYQSEMRGCYERLMGPRPLAAPGGGVPGMAPAPPQPPVGQPSYGVAPGQPMAPGGPPTSRPPGSNGAPPGPPNGGYPPLRGR